MTDTIDDPRRRAGAAAERQMQFYLHRRFADDAGVRVLHDLRLVDPEQPDPDGTPGVAQIDHLVLHRHGIFIVESKSVHDVVTVRSDGHGGDEWSRRFRGRESGFPSPIRQARRQGDFLRAVLDAHRAELLGRMPVGLRTISRAVHKSDQRTFRRLPVQVVVAISDSGRIQRAGGWKEPKGDLGTFVLKADLVPDTIASERDRHRQARRLLGETDGDYGAWSMSDSELDAVAAFLRGRHVPAEASSGRQAAATPPASTPAPTPAPPPPSPPPSPPTANPPEAACKSCRGRDLDARSGRYGYYWACRTCDTNTAMPLVCGACGHDGRRDRSVRVRKAGPDFLRVCSACGLEERIWTAAGP